MRVSFLFMRDKPMDDMEKYVSRHEYMERTGRTDDKINGIDRRLTKVEELGEKLSDMAETMQGMLSTLQFMQQQQNDIGERVKKIEEVPSDNWNKLVYTLIAMIASAALTWIIAKGGV